MRVRKSELQLLAQFVRRTGGLLIAGLWRRLMFRTTFIAITGSVGKTTCKDMVASVLSAHFSTVRTSGNSNHYKGVVLTVLSVRPWHKFAVIEVGLDRPGQMKGFCRALRPDVGILTNVARTHIMNYGSLEAIAQEKTRLIAGLRPGALAILNDDNPYIAAYEPPAGVEVVYCGSTDRSTARPIERSGAFPDRFSLTAEIEGERILVQTPLIGTHWSPSVLPALVVARRAGISAENTARAMEQSTPMTRRLQPTVLPNGATMLRDDSNGSIDTLNVALEVLKNARAKRRVLVFTDVSDSSQRARERYRDIGRAVAASADAAVYIGEHCERGAKAAVNAGLLPENVTAFYGIQAAAEHLSRELRPDDVVLLRGRRLDHLARIPISMFQEVTCWREHCALSITCEKCKRLNQPQPEG